MSAPSFTPGPWSACKNGQCSCGFIWSADGNVHVASAHGPDALGKDWFGGDMACNRECQKANANLIAAAPELYEVAQLYLDWGHLSSAQLEAKYPEWDRTEGVKFIDAKARAALAKARGEQVPA